jgi:hypothetical protein
MDVWVRVRVCSLAYPECNAYASHCDVICAPPPPSNCTIFFDIISQTARFSKKKVIKYKMCFGFLYNFCLNISDCKKNSARNCHKCENIFMLNTGYSCRILMKLEFPRKVFEKLNYQVSSNSVQWEASCSMRTDGHEVNSRISQFCLSA